MRNCTVDFQSLYTLNISALSPGQTLLIFDLDRTLYNYSLSVLPTMVSNYQKILLAKTGEHFCSNRLEDMYKEYGCFFRAGNKLYDINSQDMENIHHDNIYEELEEDKRLKEILKTLSTIKNNNMGNKFRFWIMSNGSKEHVTKCLNKLGLEEFFELVIYLDNFNDEFLAKPMSECYELVNAKLNFSPLINNINNNNNKEIIFFDDSEENLIKGREFGWSCHKISAVKCIKTVLEELFKYYL